MKKKGLLFLALGFFLCLLILGIVASLANRYSPDIPAEAIYDLELETGIVSGSLGYPSEGIPEMGVCAENIKTKDLYCTYEMLESNDYTYNLGYLLEVPIGSYYVFSHLVTPTNSETGYTDEEKAYYSEFVTCGMNTKCKSHKPIKVEVESGSRQTQIDPIDWYN